MDYEEQERVLKSTKGKLGNSSSHVVKDPLKEGEKLGLSNGDDGDYDNNDDEDDEFLLIAPPASKVVEKCEFKPHVRAKGYLKNKHSMTAQDRGVRDSTNSVGTFDIHGFVDKYYIEGDGVGEATNCLDDTNIAIVGVPGGVEDYDEEDDDEDDHDYESYDDSENSGRLLTYNGKSTNQEVKEGTLLSYGGSRSSNRSRHVLDSITAAGTVTSTAAATTSTIPSTISQRRDNTTGGCGMNDNNTQASTIESFQSDLNLHALEAEENDGDALTTESGNAYSGQAGSCTPHTPMGYLNSSGKFDILGFSRVLTPNSDEEAEGKALSAHVNAWADNTSEEEVADSKEDDGPLEFADDHVHPDSHPFIGFRTDGVAASISPNQKN